MLLRPACCIVLMLSAFWLGGCSDTMTAQAPPSARTLARDYDRTLTKAERQQAISDLRAEAEQKNPNAQSDGGDPAAEQN